MAVAADRTRPTLEWDGGSEKGDNRWLTPTLPKAVSVHYANAVNYDVVMRVHRSPQLSGTRKLGYFGLRFISKAGHLQPVLHLVIFFIGHEFPVVL